MTWSWVVEPFSDRFWNKSLQKLRRQSVVAQQVRRDESPSIRCQSAAAVLQLSRQTSCAISSELPVGGVLRCQPWDGVT